MYAIPADTSGVWVEAGCKSLCESTPGCRSIGWSKNLGIKMVANCTLYAATCAEVPTQCYFSASWEPFETTTDRLSEYHIRVRQATRCVT
jgi:hypothetical protein